MFADFSVDGKPHTLADDLTVDGTVRSRRAARARRERRRRRPARRAHRGREPRRRGVASWRFAVTRDGRPVAVEHYLGAKGHLVALRQGDLAFLHVHPDEDRLRFMADVPDRRPLPPVPAVQDRDGRVHTAAFTQEVAR